jgi:hypothetical protein
MTMVTVTGTVNNAAGHPLSGTVTFTPSTGEQDPQGNPQVTGIIDPGDQEIIAMTGVTEDFAGGKFTVTVLATDTAGVSPEGWSYLVTFNVPGIPAWSNRYVIPSSPDPVDLSQLTPIG